ncbi:hypothetical protein JXJ21_21165 [candidate division KSB1 bacterium]|nr:hypothetical protein [candidate division KSB1 bacterium]
MFYEYALIPDIFEVKNYSAANIFEHCLNPLKEVLLDHAVVRDLKRGEWSEYIWQNLTHWHPKTKELLKKLKKQNRLRLFNHCSGKHHACDTDWCVEAEFSHKIEKLDGIIISINNSDTFASNPLYSDIERLQNSSFWRSRSCSRRVSKNMADYVSASKILLGCSNSLMFIDPHIDPGKNQYSGFTDFFDEISKRYVRPHIEVHRVGWHTKDQKGAPVFEDNDKWKSTFKKEWEPKLSLLRMEVTVYIWDDFHDRYLISDIGGISVAYGFDTSNRTDLKTTWTRLSRHDRDDIQREFDLASGSHNLRCKFTVGKNQS